MPKYLITETNERYFIVEAEDPQKAYDKYESGEKAEAGDTGWDFSTIAVME